ncbi:EpsD family peptidyl-prolyl cis-trans isomerase [Paucimonas lemoignei]|uniref:EpsD family peptidyl-prolyl cis-trans isomerase n=2 Tax=Paucimonas lemoignei TaxID=29443 RepID=A0A4R3I381_PAULE|nr:EpsD family peptidyl-prolyl cis-trans isomerase [Paucimonas lemoignei]
MLVTVTTVLATLIGCSSEFRGEPVAMVNGKAITQLQLGEELGQLNVAANDDIEKTKALQGLIDRELLRAEAVRNRIDKDPHVAAALENARTQILAQAYLQSRVAYARVPSRDEVRAYFESHPEKFAGRKQFHVKELTLAPDAITTELKSAMDDARTLDDMAAWLDGRRIGYGKNARALNTTDLPAQVQAKMREMKPGQIFLSQDGANASVMAIIDIQDSPMSLEAATPHIERMLLERQGTRLGESELTRLRASARVEYTEKDVSRLAGTSRQTGASSSEKIVKVSGSQPGTAQ